MKFFYVTNIFDPDIFDNETAALLKLFGICTEMYFLSLFFLNEKNITTSLLMVHLKFTIVHYANLNSSFINKPFLNYEPLNMLLFLFMLILTRLLSEESFEDLEINSNLKLVPQCPIKWRPLKFLRNYTKVLFS